MVLPKQSPPVARQVSHAAMLKAGIGASQSIPCQLCHAACDQLGGIAKTLCNLACDNTVCRL